mmetsp:Transcript_40253/g.61427  ORF Transcript_40253/g.61427 Transcript_40253/m.61427 type:complete len:81 (+) Transcript_40253:542-784(+)
MSIVTHFFDALDMGNRTDSEIDKILGLQEIEFRNFMELFDFHDSWIYSGSLAFPPCSRPTLWRLPQKVYPVELIHMYQVR